MVDKTQLAMLKESVGAWNAWRASHADLTPDLAGADLCGLDLIEANLAGADLRHADLRGADLTKAVLADAHLEGANFFRAVLDRADLTRAHLDGALFLWSDQLTAGRNWQSAFRDPQLSCGAAIPAGH